MKTILSFLRAFKCGWFECRHQKDCAGEAKKMHENLDESQVDKMVRDSFPASDPPSTY